MEGTPDTRDKDLPKLTQVPQCGIQGN